MRLEVAICMNYKMASHQSLSGISKWFFEMFEQFFVQTKRGNCI